MAKVKKSHATRYIGSIWHNYEGRVRRKMESVSIEKCQFCGKFLKDGAHAALDDANQCSVAGLRERIHQLEILLAREKSESDPMADWGPFENRVMRMLFGHATIDTLIDLGALTNVDPKQVIRSALASGWHQTACSCISWNKSPEVRTSFLASGTRQADAKCAKCSGSGKKSIIPEVYKR